MQTEGADSSLQGARNGLRLAAESDATPVNMPGDTAWKVNHELLETLALLECLQSQVDLLPPMGEGERTCPASRLSTLNSLAQQGIERALKRLEPYV